MRIRTVQTPEQFAAVVHAAEAARIIVHRLPQASMLELAAEKVPGIDKYDLFNVWPSGTGNQLWTDAGAADGPLTDDDVDRITSLLAAAGESDPNVFEPGELASGAWQLFLHDVLKTDLDLTVERLGIHAFIDVGLSEDKLAGLIRDTAANSGTGSPDDDVNPSHPDARAVVAKATIDAGAYAQVAYLIEHLGEPTAWSAVEIYAAAAT